MKKILALLLVVFAATTQAKEVVTLEYGFSAGDTIVSSARALAEEANRLQDKYDFQVDVKSGAGSSIAANYVLRNPNTILFISSAFFVRPNFYPNESYDMYKFKELMPLCRGPMSIASVKYKSWNEVPTDKPLTIGTSGLGVVSHLDAIKIIEKYPNMHVVPFKSTTDALVGTIGGQVDMNVGFPGEQEEWAHRTPAVHILGFTGEKAPAGYQALANLGFSKILAQADQVHQFMVPATLPDEKFKEWRSILVKAAKASAVKNTFKLDHCMPASDMTDDNLQPFFNKQVDLWKSLSSGVKIN
jgi:tripartite-type tricarboxylate transporter receptor subunit TctC